MALATEDQNPPAKDTFQQTPDQKPINPKRPSPTRTIETCSTRNGNALCQSMYDLASSYNWTCTGSPCYTVWNNQANQLREFNYTYDHIVHHLKGNTRFNTDIGTRARKLAYSICSTSSEGIASIIGNIAFLENLALNRLAQIQKRAGRRSPYQCLKTVR
jgi:hypothetical protein